MRRKIVAAMFVLVMAAVTTDLLAQDGYGPWRIGNITETVAVTGQHATATTFPGQSLIWTVCSAACRVALADTNVHTGTTTAVFLPANVPVVLRASGTRYVLVNGSSGNLEVTEIIP